MAKARIYLLHGWSVDPDNEKKWSVFRQFLEKKEIETVFLGLPGLTTEHDESWTLNEYVVWLKKQLPDLEKVTVLGHSFGGQLATRFAALYPDRVERLILIDSAGIRDTQIFVVLKRFIFGILAKIGRLVTKSATARAILYKVVRERDYLDASPSLRATMRSVLQDQVLDDLPKISCPTHIIWGKYDSQTPLRLGRRFAAGIPHAKLEVIESARHSPHFTHPAITSQVVAEFMEQNS